MAYDDPHKICSQLAGERALINVIMIIKIAVILRVAHNKVTSLSLTKTLQSHFK